MYWHIPHGIQTPVIEEITSGLEFVGPGLDPEGLGLEYTTPPGFVFSQQGSFLKLIIEWLRPALFRGEWVLLTTLIHELRLVCLSLKYPLQWSFDI